MSHLRKVTRKPKKSSPLAKSDMSLGTLDDLDKQLDKFGNHREHLQQDNTYDDSRAGSPTVSSVDLQLQPPDEDDEETPSATESHTPSSPSSSVEILSEKEVSVMEREVKRANDKKIRRYRFKNMSHRHQASILDMQSSRKSTFFGFYTLFWVTIAVMFLRTVVNNYVYYRQLIGTNIPDILYRDLIKIALTDGWMYGMTYFGVVLQKLIKKDYVSWNRTGWLIQNAYQTTFLFFFLWFADYMNFPWIGSVFLLLHSLVLLMKQHSYAFYNGYLWGIRREREDAKKILAKVAGAADADPQDLERLNQQIEFCEEELDMQSTKIPFPTNITFQNYFIYSMFPTVVYQLEYPRTSNIRWFYVFEKVAATFGVMFLMIVLAENYLYPIAMRALDLRNTSLTTRMIEYPFIMMDLVPPFILMYLLVFYIIWDAILNGIAELTCFGDREFYGEWWNCVTWDQFAKEWNTPVHRFLLRHVYHSSMSAFNVNKSIATLLTFLLSSCIHELVMWAIFKKLRGYLLILQMCQLPLVAVSRTKYLRGKDTLGNIIFWFGIITGPSLMCSLYLTF